MYTAVRDFKISSLKANSDSANEYMYYNHFENLFFNILVKPQNGSTKQMFYHFQYMYLQMLAMLSDVLKMLVMLISLLTLVNAVAFCDNAESYV